jgi:hypothetical protein
VPPLAALAVSPVESPDPPEKLVPLQPSRQQPSTHLLSKALPLNRENVNHLNAARAENGIL